MFRIILPAVAALGLVAFAAQPGTAGSDPADAASAPAETMEWNVHYEGRLAKLTYGVAQSDQLAMMVTCAAGDPGAVVYGHVQPEGARMIPTRQVIDPLSGGEAFETRIPVSGPWLAGLAEHGRMTVTGGEGRLQLRASVEERRLVAGFLAYCAPRRV